jgi:hypothetical protein
MNLIERLLGGAPTQTDGGTDWQALNDLHQEAADALEAKDKRIAELEAEIARLRVDVGRYRWLRDNGQCNEKTGSRALITGDNPLRRIVAFRCWCYPEGLDAAIDAAIDAAKESV